MQDEIFAHIIANLLTREKSYQIADQVFESFSVTWLIITHIHSPSLISDHLQIPILLLKCGDNFIRL